MPWIKEVERVTSVDDLKTSRSIFRSVYPNLETLDVRIATALKKNIQNSNFKKKVRLEEQKDSSVAGRQIAFMIYEYFWVTSTHETLLAFGDQMRVTLHVETTCGVWTPDGMMSYYQPMKCHLKVCRKGFSFFFKKKTR